MTEKLFGQLAQDEKDRRGWSVRDLAAKANTTVTSADLVVRGYDVRLSTALKIAAALELDTGDLGTAGDLK